MKSLDYKHLRAMYEFGFTWAGDIGAFDITKKSLQRLVRKGYAHEDMNEYRLTDAGRQYLKDQEPSSLAKAADKY